MIMKIGAKQIFILIIIFLLVIMPAAFASSMNVALKIEESNAELKIKEKIGSEVFLESVWNKVTGNAIALEDSTPGLTEVSCMMSCMGCSSIGIGCTGNREQCMAQCNVKPEPKAANEGEECMQKCIKVGCTEFDFSCQEKNKETCEKDCGMLGDKPDESEMSAEQLCITKCVESVDPTIRCGASQTGETGGSVCQKCASDCVHLYAGPCLDDEKLKAKQKECETCEHCYGEPVMGDSGEGWECITGVECKDASAEFGDLPGTGPGIGQEGFVATIGTGIGNVFEEIGNFFKGLFGGENSESPSDSLPPMPTE